MGRSKSLEDRARAEVERVKGLEQAERDRAQARLDELAAEARTRKEAEDKRVRLEAERTARQREDGRAAAEERAKQAAFRGWAASGGAPADFEAAWPEMRREAAKRRTLDADEAARASQRRISGI